MTAISCGTQNRLSQMFHLIGFGWHHGTHYFVTLSYGRSDDPAALFEAPFDKTQGRLFVSAHPPVTCVHLIS